MLVGALLICARLDSRFALVNHSLLLLFAHPHVESSHVQRRLLDAVRDLDGLTVHSLYDTYPDFFVDVRREQALLLAHDGVVFQHPLYWYAGPPLLKEWMDRVFEHEFAFGQRGDKLAGKHFLQVVSAGEPEHAYTVHGRNGRSVAELLRPFSLSARYCGMVAHAPLVLHGASTTSDEAAHAFAMRYRENLARCLRGVWPPEQALHDAERAE